SSTTRRRRWPTSPPRCARAARRAYSWPTSRPRSSPARSADTWSPPRRCSPTPTGGSAPATRCAAASTPTAPRACSPRVASASSRYTAYASWPISSRPPSSTPSRAPTTRCCASSWPPPPAPRTATSPPSSTSSPGARRDPAVRGLWDGRVNGRVKGPTLAHPPDPVPGWWPGPSDDPPPAAPLGRQAPRYGTGSLADLLPSVLAVLGVPGTVDALGLRRRLDGVRRVALLLVDGLGHHLLPLAARSAPTLADLATGRLGYATAITAGFPSTTPTSLVTVGTGAPPGPHGILGFTVNVPGTDLVLRHVDWDSDPAPRGWQPLDTRFEQARAAG